MAARAPPHVRHLDRLHDGPPLARRHDRLTIIDDEERGEARKHAVRRGERDDLGLYRLLVFASETVAVLQVREPATRPEVRHRREIHVGARHLERERGPIGTPPVMCSVRPVSALNAIVAARPAKSRAAAPARRPAVPPSSAIARFSTTGAPISRAIASSAVEPGTRFRQHERAATGLRHASTARCSRWCRRQP